ncbi:CapA family protein [Desulfovibrio sp. OttesenSCG-928-A18]|nr:CapA family protein [Desulfovibrio sp. OttesenSCG-928-A18]
MFLQRVRSRLLGGAAAFGLLLLGLSLFVAQGHAASGAGAGGRLVRIAAVGDIMMANEGSLPADGGAGIFRDLKPQLKGCDVVLGNLEGPLTNRGKATKVASSGRSYVFRTPPSYGKHLKDAGFTMLSLANNHANDYGPEGRAQTRELLESLGIGHTGAPGQVSVQMVGGTRIAFIGLAPNRGCQNINDIPGAVALVKREAAKPNTLVVVTFHGGGEGASFMKMPTGPESYLGEKRGDLRKLSHAVIDAGAALVIGHGPHVPRGFEIYKERLIAYSLGNFATGVGINVQGPNGLAPLLLVDLDASGRLVDMKIVSFRQQRGKGPRMDRSNEAAKVMLGMSGGYMPEAWLRRLQQ